MQGYIIGLDVGGTHIDTVIVKDNQIIDFLKTPYDSTNLANSIDDVLRQVLQDLDSSSIFRVQLSTTLTTNTLIQRTGESVDLILESPGLKHNFNHLDAKIHHIDGYINHQGEEITALNVSKLPEIEGHLSQNHNLGIIGKFSTRNHSHENQIKNHFKDKIDFITTGHEVSGKLNFKRRVETVYLNNYVQNSFRPFANQIKNTLKEMEVHAPIYILKADGGTMLLEEAISMPVETILSGPAASYMGLKSLMKQDGDGILLDIGGTTTDVFFVVDGNPLFEPKGITIEGHKTLIRSIFSKSLPLGGDRTVMKKGTTYHFEKRDGFAAGFGGQYATVTDALIVLGNIEGGDLTRSEAILQSLDKTSNPQFVAKEIIDYFIFKLSNYIYDEIEEINKKPLYTIKEVIEDRKFMPTYIQTIGGPAKALNPYIENCFKIGVDSPDAFAYANALGAALSEPTSEITILVNTRRKSLVIPEKGIEREIDKSYNLEDAIGLAKLLLGSEDIDIIEASQFNMVSYFGESDRNIRVVAQLKPRLIRDWRMRK